MSKLEKLPVAALALRFLRDDGGATAIRPGTSDPEFAEAAAWLGRLRFGRP